jgi:hypothetical protein
VVEELAEEIDATDIMLYMVVHDVEVEFDVTLILGVIPD